MKISSIYLIGFAIFSNYAIWLISVASHDNLFAVGCLLLLASIICIGICKRMTNTTNLDYGLTIIKLAGTTFVFCGFTIMLLYRSDAFLGFLIVIVGAISTSLAQVIEIKREHTQLSQH